MLKLLCLECEKEIERPEEDWKELLGCTTDCPYCGALLLIKVVGESLHKSIHRTDARWPVDGEGTDSIEFYNSRRPKERLDLMIGTDIEYPGDDSPEAGARLPAGELWRHSRLQAREAARRA